MSIIQVESPVDMKDAAHYLHSMFADMYSKL